MDSDRPKGTPKFHPKLLKAYDIPTKPVGEGGFGVVYLAKHLKSGDAHAIKVISAAPDSAETVTHEVSIMQVVSKKRSPHVVRILGYEKDTWQHYLVLQACEGGELFDRIADHVFTEEEAANAVEQVLLGLKACHDAGVCHRDMKPENVLYGTRAPDSKLLITDFGLSCRYKQGKKSITDWCGTTPYMAPEVFICSKQKTPYGCECDLWSTGVLVYILLTGYMPFDGDEATTEKNVCAGKYSMSPSVIGNISDAAKDFLKRLLEVDPDKRMTAEQAMAHPWITEKHTRASEPVNQEVANRLKKFAKQTRLERKLRFVIAQQLSIQEIATLKEEFSKLDTDNTGKLSHHVRATAARAPRPSPWRRACRRLITRAPLARAPALPLGPALLCDRRCKPTCSAPQTTPSTRTSSHSCSRSTWTRTAKSTSPSSSRRRWTRGCCSTTRSCARRSRRWT